jgi:hypothetical protein
MAKRKFDFFPEYDDDVVGLSNYLMQLATMPQPVSEKEPIRLSGGDVVGLTAEQTDRAMSRIQAENQYNQGLAQRQREQRDRKIEGMNSRIFRAKEMERRARQRDEDAHRAERWARERDDIQFDRQSQLREAERKAAMENVGEPKFDKNLNAYGRWVRDPETGNERFQVVDPGVPIVGQNSGSGTGGAAVQGAGIGDGQDGIDFRRAQDINIKAGLPADHEYGFQQTGMRPAPRPALDDWANDVAATMEAQRVAAEREREVAIQAREARIRMLEEKENLSGLEANERAQIVSLLDEVARLQGMAVTWDGRKWDLR